MDRLWVVMWIQQLPGFLCVGAVPAFARDYACYRREVKNGMYHPLCYALTDTVVNLLFWFVLSLVAILPAFIMVELNWGNFVSIWLLVTSYVGWMDSVAQLCGTLFASTSLSTMVFIMQCIVNLIFNGIWLAQTNEVPWVLRWICYVVPSRYSFRSGVRLEFKDTSFSGFRRCRFPSPCWGTDGLDVVAALSKEAFPLLTTRDTLLEDLALIVGEVIVLKFMRTLLILWKSR